MDEKIKKQIEKIVKEEGASGYEEGLPYEGNKAYKLVFEAGNPYLKDGVTDGITPVLVVKGETVEILGGLGAMFYYDQEEEEKNNPTPEERRKLSEQGIK